MICNRCDGSGFLNLHQIDEDVPQDYFEYVLNWIKTHDDHDVSVCDCCGNGVDAWYGNPGYHYSHDDPPGNHGPYAYNGGLPECS